MKFLGLDKNSGLPVFAWCCDKARDAKDVIGFINDGRREYDSDRTGFYVTGKCKGDGKHEISKIFFCPYCGALVEN